jgi:hypothetical protein
VPPVKATLSVLVGLAPPQPAEIAKAKSHVYAGILIAETPARCMTTLSFIKYNLPLGPDSGARDEPTYLISLPPRRSSRTNRFAYGIFTPTSEAESSVALIGMIWFAARRYAVIA